MKPVKESKTVKVRILDKEVSIGCTAGDEEDLARAAHFVDSSMREFRGRNITSTIEKIAIITAINMANDLLKLQASTGSAEALKDKLSQMQKQIDAALSGT